MLSPTLNQKRNRRELLSVPRTAEASFQVRITRERWQKVQDKSCLGGEPTEKVKAVHSLPPLAAHTCAAWSHLGLEEALGSLAVVSWCQNEDPSRSFQFLGPERIHGGGLCQ